MIFEGTPEQLTELFAALVEARKNFKEIKKDTLGQEGERKYQYAPLANLVAATAQALADQGLLVLQPFSIDDTNGQGLGTLTTLLIHRSGGKLVDTSTFFLAADIKKIGGQSTYMARYAYQRLLVLDGEDDADSHSQKPSESRTAKRPRTSEQDDKVIHLAGELGMDAKQIGDMCRKVTGVGPEDAGYDETSKLIKHMAQLLNDAVKAKAGVRNSPGGQGSLA